MSSRETFLECPFNTLTNPFSTSASATIFTRSFFSFFFVVILRAFAEDCSWVREIWDIWIALKATHTTNLAVSSSRSTKDYKLLWNNFITFGGQMFFWGHADIFYSVMHTLVFIGFFYTFCVSRVICLFRVSNLFMISTWSTSWTWATNIIISTSAVRTCSLIHFPFKSPFIRLQCQKNHVNGCTETLAVFFFIIIC